MKTAIVWLRRDLRLVDNPALAAAASASERVLPVYLWTPEEDGAWPPGGAQRWWLHASLHALDARLRRRGGQLVFGRGEALSATSPFGSIAVASRSTSSPRSGRRRARSWSRGRSVRGGARASPGRVHGRAAP